MRRTIALLTLVLLAAVLVTAQQACSELNVKVTRVSTLLVNMCLYI